MKISLDLFKQSEAVREINNQNVKPILEFSIDRFFRNGPFSDFCFIHTTDMEEDITLENDREKNLYGEVAAYVHTREGIIPDRNLYKKDKIFTDKSHMGTYTIANAISWNIHEHNPPSMDDVLETVLAGFKNKIYTGLTDVIAMAAQENHQKSLSVLLRSIKRKSGRSVDYFYYDCDVEDDKTRLFSNTIKGGNNRVIEGDFLKNSVNKTKGNYDDSGRKPIIAVALDPADKDYGVKATKTPFVVAQRGLGKIFLDTSMHRSGTIGLYGWAHIGIACHAPESVGIAYVKDE